MNLIFNFLLFVAGILVFLFFLGWAANTDWTKFLNAVGSRFKSPRKKTLDDVIRELDASYESTRTKARAQETIVNNLFDRVKNSKQDEASLKNIIRAALSTNDDEKAKKTIIKLTKKEKDTADLEARLKLAKEEWFATNNEAENKRDLLIRANEEKKTYDLRQSQGTDERTAEEIASELADYLNPSEAAAKAKIRVNTAINSNDEFLEAAEDSEIEQRLEEFRKEQQ